MASCSTAYSKTNASGTSKGPSAREQHTMPRTAPGSLCATMGRTRVSRGTQQGRGGYGPMQTRNSSDLGFEAEMRTERSATGFAERPRVGRLHALWSSWSPRRRAVIVLVVASRFSRIVAKSYQQVDHPPRRHPARPPRHGLVRATPSTLPGLPRPVHAPALMEATNKLVTIGGGIGELRPSTRGSTKIELTNGARSTRR